MTLLTWILLALAFGGAAWVWYRVQHDKSGAVSCCGCGQCAATGECVMVKGKKRVKKEENPS